MRRASTERGSIFNDALGHAGDGRRGPDRDQTAASKKSRARRVFRHPSDRLQAFGRLPSACSEIFLKKMALDRLHGLWDGGVREKVRLAEHQAVRQDQKR